MDIFRESSACGVAEDIIVTLGGVKSFSSARRMCYEICTFHQDFQQSWRLIRFATVTSRIFQGAVGKGE